MVPAFENRESWGSLFPDSAAKRQSWASPPKTHGLWNNQLRKLPPLFAALTCPLLEPANPDSQNARSNTENCQPNADYSEFPVVHSLVGFPNQPWRIAFHLRPMYPSQVCGGPEGNQQPYCKECDRHNDAEKTKH